MKTGKIIIFMFFFMLITCLIMMLIWGRTFFKVKNVQISKDFQIDNYEIIKFLNIYPLRPIWEYQTATMEKKLSDQFYLEDYRIDKIYPDTLKIRLVGKKPLVLIAGSGGKLFCVDKNGIAFKETDNTEHRYPLILSEVSDQIETGFQLKGILLDTVTTLGNLQKKLPRIYEAIAQIDVKIINNYQNELMIYFKTIHNIVYLKNTINVDSIRRGFSCIRLLKSRNDNRPVYYTGNGFFLSNQL